MWTRSRRISIAPDRPLRNATRSPATWLRVVEAQRHRVLELDRHPGQRVEVLVRVEAHAEIHLPERIEPVHAQQLEQHADLDAVAGDERHPQQVLADERALAGQRLGEAEEAGLVPPQQRPGDELGHAAAAGRLPFAPVPRPVVEALDHDERRVAQQRVEQPDDERRVEVLDVGVEEHPDLTGHPGQPGLHRAALAAVPTAGTDPVDRRSGPRRLLGGARRTSASRPRSPRARARRP